MNKVEKETEKKLLKNEKEILKELKKAHIEAYKQLEKEIKLLEQEAKILEKDPNKTKLQSKIYQKEYKEALQKQIDYVINTLNDKSVDSVDKFLEKNYQDSYKGNIKAISTRGVDIKPKLNEKLLIKSITQANHGATFSERLYKNADKVKAEALQEIQKGIALGDGYDKIASSIKNRLGVSYSNAYRIARTEGARVGVDAKLDSIQQAINDGVEMYKEWSAAMDKRTRKAHADLDGQLQPFDKPFQWSGGEVDAPHRFGIASQDINCRCTILSRPLADLSEDEKAKLGVKKKPKKIIKSVTVGNTTLSFKEMLQRANEVEKMTRKKTKWNTYSGMDNKVTPKRFTEKAVLFELNNKIPEYEGWTFWRPKSLLKSEDGRSLADNESLATPHFTFKDDDIITLNGENGKIKKLTLDEFIKLLGGKLI